jgi:hypothetical protein
VCAGRRHVGLRSSCILCSPSHFRICPSQAASDPQPRKHMSALGSLPCVRRIRSSIIHPGPTVRFHISGAAEHRGYVSLPPVCPYARMPVCASIASIIQTSIGLAQLWPHIHTYTSDILYIHAYIQVITVHTFTLSNMLVCPYQHVWRCFLSFVYSKFKFFEGKKLTDKFVPL